MNIDNDRPRPQAAAASPGRPEPEAEHAGASAKTAEVAAVIRNAADRLTASAGPGEPQAIAQIAAGLRTFADTLEEDTANVLVEAVDKIARANPSSFLAGSVMAGLALEQAEPGSSREAAPRSGSGFVEQALNLLRSSLEGEAEGDIAEAGRHPLPLALAAVSIAWLLAQPEAEEEPPAAGAIGSDGDSVFPGPPPAAPQDPVHPHPAVAPGGLGYIMTLSHEEEEQIEWGSKSAT